jgi:hypothetical protein
MRQTLRLAGLVVAAVAVCPAVHAGNLEPPGPPAPTMITLDQLVARHAFVGYTTARRNGGVGTGSGLTGSGGTFGMGAVCRAEFPGTRICTSEDIWNSQPVTPIGNDCAWVQPSSDPSGMMTGGSCLNQTFFFPWGDSDPGNLGDTGMSMAPSTNTLLYGAFVEVSCRTMCRIACCTVN